jgi:hypothetical protein
MVQVSLKLDDWTSRAALQPIRVVLARLRRLDRYALLLLLELDACAVLLMNLDGALQAQRRTDLSFGRYTRHLILVPTFHGPYDRLYGPRTVPET